MWRAESDCLNAGETRKIHLCRGNLPVSRAAVIDAWRHTPEFADWFARSLAAVPYPAFFWETPPFSTTNLDRPFEFVLVSSPQLAAVNAEPAPFRDQLRVDRDAVTFSNLGGDAVLIAPCPAPDTGHWAHLAQYLRTARVEHMRTFWKAVGDALAARVNVQPTWCSTSGLGVYWPHVRLDSSPKYYTHASYRRADA